MSNKRADDYRARARECLAKAADSRDPEVKRQFQEAAEHWLYMADQVERLGL